MLIPIRHENMTARRWPVITLALIVLNTVVFLGTNSTIEDQAAQLGPVKARILSLAAQHPDLTMPADVQEFVTTVREHQPAAWKEFQHPSNQLENLLGTHSDSSADPEALQDQMDSLATQYSKLEASSILDQYAFIPTVRKPVTYLTASFLHGGWLHLIGNMWFLWLAGFVLEDAWGRALYSIVYLVAGAVALQFYAWMSPHSLAPTLGASGAVAALMGAFLVRFPKMRIEMLWFFSFRVRRFKAPAFYLLPLWLLMEVFYGSLFGSSSGVAHWAHVGGFAFGALAALALRYSGLEHKANAAVEAEVSWQNDPAIVQATEMLEKGQLDEAAATLQQYLATETNSLDGWSLLQQVYWRKSDLPAYREATMKACALHIKAKASEAAWQDFEDFRNGGGENPPAATWFDLARIAEEQQNYERALAEYQKLAAVYPNERQAMMAQMAQAKLYLRRLNRPEEALKLYQAAAASKTPHLDWEQTIQAGIREAKEAMGIGTARTANATA